MATTKFNVGDEVYAVLLVDATNFVCIQAEVMRITLGKDIISYDFSHKKNVAFYQAVEEFLFKTHDEAKTFLRNRGYTVI